MSKFLQLAFFPFSANAGLLLLRLWFGLSMLVLHGIPKLVNFSTYAQAFVDFLGIGPAASLVLAIVGEVGCALLLVAGLFTRLAALGAAITMAVAFFMAHGGALSGDNSGEMAFLYLGAYLVLYVTGAGRYAIDAYLHPKPEALDGMYQPRP
ncbi:DoxX family protein [Hymenobacter sp. B81]|uniref:DoxX family protein n=1 Tax=Hymenobacter sp. B81 TaxID=3344878 RepID=UPI0037DDA810